MIYVNAIDVEAMSDPRSSVKRYKLVIESLQHLTSLILPGEGVAARLRMSTLTFTAKY